MFSVLPSHTKCWNSSLQGGASILSSSQSPTHISSLQASTQVRSIRRIDSNDVSHSPHLSSLLFAFFFLSSRLLACRPCWVCLSLSCGCAQSCDLSPSPSIERIFFLYRTRRALVQVTSAVPCVRACVCSSLFPPHSLSPSPFLTHLSFSVSSSSFFTASSRQPGPSAPACPATTASRAPSPSPSPPVTVPTAAVASPPCPLLLPVPPHPPAHVSPPLAAMVPIISVVPAPPDTATEAPPQVPAVAE